MAHRQCRGSYEKGDNGKPCKLSAVSWALSLLQADKSRVKDYIHRLDNFDGPAVGEIAAGYDMFEEAFEIYKKFNLKTQAIKVLLDNMDDTKRAHEYATKVPSVPHLSILKAVSIPKIVAHHARASMLCIYQVWANIPVPQAGRRAPSPPLIAPSCRQILTHAAG